MCYHHPAGTRAGPALWSHGGRWDLHSGSGRSPPALHPSCHHQPVLWGALALGMAKQDRKYSCLPVIPHVLFLTPTEQIPNSCPFAALSSWSQTKTLGSEDLSSPVFKSSSAHCMSPDAGGVHFKGSPSLLRGKGHEYQSLSNSKGCFFLIREVKCRCLFSAASAFLRECQRYSVSS